MKQKHVNQKKGFGDNMDIERKRKGERERENLQCDDGACFVGGQGRLSIKVGRGEEEGEGEENGDEEENGDDVMVVLLTTFFFSCSFFLGVGGR